MNPFPQDKSVLILDNCAIHKTRALREIIEGFGCVLLFLPSYSPDFNPIEESFSCGMSCVCAYNSCSAGELTKSFQSNNGFVRTGIGFKPPNTWRSHCSSPQQQLQRRSREGGSFILGIMSCRCSYSSCCCMPPMLYRHPHHFIPVACSQIDYVIMHAWMA